LAMVMTCLACGHRKHSKCVCKFYRFPSDKKAAKRWAEFTG